MDPALQERLERLEAGEAAGKLRPEHQAELEGYRKQELAAPKTYDDPARIALRQRGIPRLPAVQDPYLPINDPKQRDMARRSAVADGNKVFLKTAPDIDKARKNLLDISEFESLNESIRPTGSFLDSAYQTARGWLGDGDRTRMDQLSTNMARQQRQPGEGAVSDFEGKMFQRMVGNKGQPGSSNSQFAAASRIVSQRAIDHRRFQENFLATNSTLIGAEDTWQKYLTANPMFTRDGKLQPVKPFSEWLAGGFKRNQKLPNPPPGTRNKPTASNDGWSITPVE
jgi:hypothetical protein